MAARKTVGTSVTKAVQSGDRMALLKAMADRVATAIDNPDTPARDLASLTRRMDGISKELEALIKQAAEEASDVLIPDESFDPNSA